MSPESSGGHAAPYWDRLNLTKRRVIAPPITLAVITNNPGEPHEIKFKQTPWNSPPPVDLRHYEHENPGDLNSKLVIPDIKKG